MKKNIRLQLAHMLKLYKEVAVEDGVLCTEGEEFIVGEEIYLITPDNEVIPAHDGEYKAGETVYVVVDGKLAEIREEKVEKEPETEPEPAADPEPEKEPETEPETEPEPEKEPETEPEESEEVKTLKQELNVVKEENEALKAKVEELEAKLKEYEEKAKETEPSAEDAEKFANEKKDKYAKVMTRMSYLKK